MPCGVEHENRWNAPNTVTLAHRRVVVDIDEHRDVGPGHGIFHRESTLRWAGGAFDPVAFDPATVKFDDPKQRWKKAFGRRP